MSKDIVIVLIICLTLIVLTILTKDDRKGGGN